jgi:hypothetical protein
MNRTPIQILVLFRTPKLEKTAYKHESAFYMIVYNVCML